MAERRYRTIVADPPWDYEEVGFSFGERHSGGGRQGKPRRSYLRYESMSVDEIAALHVQSLVDEEAHLYLWTTQRYLWDAPCIVQAWGFQPKKVLVWCKPPTGFAMGGIYGNSVEFVMFGQRGVLAPKERMPRDWFEWPRCGGHSRKPEAFLDLVERVSPGPYLELFARRARFNWDYWGDESLGTAELPEAAA